MADKASSKKVSVKHLQINKSQSSMLAVVAAAVAIVVFGLFATKALVVKGLYQRRALHAQREAVATLKDNYSAAQTLFTQYKVFAGGDPNILGGNPTGNGSLDGDNPRIILDALPSTYDAPALATSLEKILTSQAITISALSIVDDPASNSDQPTANPQAKALSFTFSGTTNFQGSQKLFQKFEQSIRPFNLNTLQITGTDNIMQISAKMTTYYQPAKSLDLSLQREVK